MFPVSSMERGIAFFLNMILFDAPTHIRCPYTADQTSSWGYVLICIQKVRVLAPCHLMVLSLLEQGVQTFCHVGQNHRGNSTKLKSSK